MCRYTYTQQPLRNLLCNPYTGRLVIECEVTYGRTESAVTLQWVFRPANTMTVSILSSTGSKYTITPGASISLARSQLRVETLSDSDAGAYYCQIRFLNGSLATRSQEMDVFTSQVFSALNQPPCSQFTAQSTRLSTCALANGIGVPPSTPTQMASENTGGGGGGGGGLTNTRDIVLWTVVGGVALFIALAVLIVISLLFCNYMSSHYCCCS